VEIRLWENQSYSCRLILKCVDNPAIAISVDSWSMGVFVFCYTFQLIDESKLTLLRARQDMLEFCILPF